MIADIMINKVSFAGKTYLKVGHGPELGMSLTTPEQIQRWFNRTEVGEKERLVYNLARKYFPGGYVKK